MAKQQTVKQGLTKELQQIVKSLDEEGIRFLVEQALILKHNQEIDQINQKITKLDQTKKMNERNTKKQSNKVEIIPADDKKSFIFIINNTRKIVTQQEMREMVKIAHQGKSAALFTWLSKERRDFLTDTSIRDKNHTLLTIMMDIMKNKFKLKK